MKKSIALIFAASTLFLAGCCTTHHVTQWEYKVVPTSGANRQEYPQEQEALMNGLGKEGWKFVNAIDGYCYFQRPVK